MSASADSSGGSGSSSSSRRRDDKKSRKSSSRSKSSRSIAREGSSRSIAREGSSRNIARNGSSPSIAREGSSRSIARNGSSRSIARAGSKRALSPEEALQQLAERKAAALKGGPESLVGWWIAMPSKAETDGPEQGEGIVASIERKLGASTKHVVRFLTGDCEALDLNRNKRKSIVGSLHQAAKVNFELLRQAEPGPSHSGLLQKLGRNGRKHWNKRHFELNPFNGRLSYFTPGTQAKGMPRGFLELGFESAHPEVWSFESEGKDPPDPAMLFCFTVVSGKRSMVLSASTRSEMDGWMSALLACVDYWCGKQSKMRKETALAKAAKLERADAAKVEVMHNLVNEMVEKGSGQASLLQDLTQTDRTQVHHAHAMDPEDEAILLMLEQNMLEVNELLGADNVELYDHIWDLVETLEAGKQDLAEIVRACRLSDGGGVSPVIFITRLTAGISALTFRSAALLLASAT